MSPGNQVEMDSAVDFLLRGYEEELNLYSVVFDLTVRQNQVLRDSQDLVRFCDLLDEKEDLLRIIGQIDVEMKQAKTFLLLQQPEVCPRRWRLTFLLDRVTRLIERIRARERMNIELLQGVPN